MSLPNAIDDGSCYGRKNTQGPNKGKWSRNHHVSATVCKTAHGPPPPGYVACHLCVNDSNVKPRGEDAFVCVNPAHLEWGTQKQNMQDAAHNMSIGQKKRFENPEAKAKLSAAMKGKKRGPYKPETKKRKQRALETKKRKPYKRVTVVVSVEPV